jgi:protein required for attachment to host cells
MPYSKTSGAKEIPPPSTARTWVAVFDGGRGAVFKNAGFDDAPSLELVFSLENENKANHELGRDKPGQVIIPGKGRAGLERVELHERREADFMNLLVDRIEESARAFDRIVLLAPSQGVRRFRERASQARSKLAGVRIGDYAHSRMERIEEAFKQAIAAKSRSTI